MKDIDSQVNLMARIKYLEDEIALVKEQDKIHQHEYKKKLKANQDEFKTIFELAPLVIVVYDLDFNLIDCNHQFLSYLSIDDKAKVLGLNVLDFLPVEERDRARQKLRQPLTGLNFQIVVKGEEKLIEISTNVIKNDKDEPRHFIAIIRDVTQLKQTEIKLKELIATKEKFFSIIANHLKNPFSAIVGFSNILSEENFNEAPNEIKLKQTQHIATVINEAAKRAAGLIENLLTWSLTQTGGLEFHPQKLILRQVVNDVMRDFKKSVSNKEIRIFNEVAELMEVYAEMPMLKTIIRILINNAIKFTKAGGSVTIDATEHEEYIEVTVSDTGVGIPPNFLEKLFRIDSKYITLGTNEEQGAGLGLILCKDLVEKHNGEVFVESTEGKGSVFRIRLPKKRE
jgi:two-component system, sensor histidine kinase and response regulator